MLKNLQVQGRPQGLGGWKDLRKVGRVRMGQANADEGAQTGPQRLWQVQAVQGQEREK